MKKIIIMTLTLMSGTALAQVPPNFSTSPRPNLPVGVPVPGMNGMNAVPIQQPYPGHNSYPMQNQQGNHNANLPVGYSQAEAEKNIPIASLRPDHGQNIDLPHSGQDVNMTQAGVNSVLDKAQTQSYARLNKMALSDVPNQSSSENSNNGNNGANNQNNLASPNLSGYQDELDELSATQRKIRLLKAKQEEADATTKLWQTLFDPKKESVDPKLAVTQAPQPNMGVPSLPPMPSQIPSFGQPVDNSKLSGKLTGNDTKKVKEKDNLPKTVSILGSADNLFATVLIPYVGERDVRVGDILPHNRKIISITEKNGVIVSDPKKGRITLVEGTSVAGGEE